MDVSFTKSLNWREKQLINNRGRNKMADFLFFCVCSRSNRNRKYPEKRGENKLPAKLISKTSHHGSRHGGAILRAISDPMLYMWKLVFIHPIKNTSGVRVWMQYVHHLVSCPFHCDFYRGMMPYLTNYEYTCINCSDETLLKKPASEHVFHII